MNLRYLMESALFFIAMIIFQIEVSTINKDLHISVAEVKIYQLMKDEIVAKGGDIYHYTEVEGAHHLLMRYLASDSHGSTGLDGTKSIKDEIKELIYAAEHGTLDLSGFTLN